MNGLRVLTFTLVMGSILMLGAATGRAVEEGQADGQFIVNGDPVALTHAYARAVPGAFDKTKEDIEVLLTDVPLDDESVEDWSLRSRMESQGTLHAVEVTIDAANQPISAQLRHDAFKASPSGNFSEFEPKAVSASSIEGRAFTEKPREFFGTTYEFNVTFKAKIRRKPPYVPPTAEEKEAAAKSEQAKVFAAWNQSIHDADIEAFKKGASKSILEQLGDDDPKEMFGFLQMINPREVRFQRLTVTGKTAVLEVLGRTDDEVSSGTVDMVQEDGGWKVQKASWKSAAE